MGAEPRKSTTARLNSEESDARAEGHARDSDDSPGNPDTETSDARPTAAGAGTKTTEPETESSEPSDSEADAESAGRRSDRSALVIAAAALAACAGLVLYGALAPEDGQPKPRAAPTAEVTYEVEGTGTVDITYRALNTSGNADKAATATTVRLPWKKSVQVPLGKDPIVSITLGEDGGRARCALTIRGRHVQSATASGEFGRATCQGELPASEATQSPTTMRNEG